MINWRTRRKWRLFDIYYWVIVEWFEYWYHYMLDMGCIFGIWIVGGLAFPSSKVAFICSRLSRILYNSSITMPRCIFLVYVDFRQVEAYLLEVELLAYLDCFIFQHSRPSLLSLNIIKLNNLYFISQLNKNQIKGKNKFC